MMRKKLLSGFLALTMLAGIVIPQPNAVSAATTAEPKEVVLEKSTLGNPIAGFNDKGEIEYAGDPNILVDGDTVYLYVGHDDTGSGGGYTMPNYFCYSTEDLVHWNFEGNVMNMTSVSWADDVSAWAAQVVKYRDKYYMLYCAENKGSRGKEIGIAVADTPTGPFIPEPDALFNEAETNTHTCKVIDPNTGLETTANKLHADITNGYGHRSSFGWEDIDPTFWLDVDENGEEHRYLMWGNTNLWMCELNEDMVSIKDQNGDGKITQGYDADIWFQNINDLVLIGDVTFTEAPYLYRRQDENGNYYGDYYVFFATHWREEMGYATTSELGPNSVWTYGGGKEGFGHLMEPTATSNTNHPAVFNFEGKTYFIYHNGSLPGGSGYRRVACIEEVKFNEDGSIGYIHETSTGISGTPSQILDFNTVTIAHDKFSNSVSDPDAEYNYPQVNVTVKATDIAEEYDAIWEIEPGKYDKNNEAYVTIEAFNKPGMYLKATADKNVVLSRDHNQDGKSTADGITQDSKAMTFRTLESPSGFGVVFESVAYKGYYIASTEKGLKLVDDYNAEECTFEVAPLATYTDISARKTDRSYTVGDKVTLDDVYMRVSYDDGSVRTITSGFTSNADSLDMTTPGVKELILNFRERGVVKSCKMNITVFPKLGEAVVGDTMEELPAVKSAHTIGTLNYQVTKVDEYNTDGTNGTVTVTGITNKKATSITVPTEVEINGYTFAVTEIGSKAFQNCKKVKSLTIGDSVKKIGKNAIKGIKKNAKINVSEERYSAVKKLLKSKTGYKKTMKFKTF